MKYFLLTISILALVACRKNTSSAGASSLKGSWVMVSVIDHQASQTFRQPQGENVIMNFSGEVPKGNFSGKTPANTIAAGEYVVSEENLISITSLFVTQVYEQQWGSFLIDNITSSDRFEITPTRQLKIFTPNFTLQFRKN